MAEVIKFKDLPDEIKSRYNERNVSRVVEWCGTYGPAYLIYNQWLRQDTWIASKTKPTTWTLDDVVDA